MSTDPVQEQLIMARRNQILDAATGVFSQKGFHRTTIRDIATAAGISDGTIYNYFKNKNDLLIGILDRMNETPRRAEHLAEAMQGDLVAFLRSYFRHRARIIFSNPAAFKATLPEVINNEELQAIYYGQIVKPSLELGEQMIAQLQAQGVIRAGDAALLTRNLTGSMVGLLFLYLIGDQVIMERWEEAADQMAEIILHGVLSASDAASSDE